MPDHLLESGDSPELEALFDRVAYQGQAPAPAPVAMAPSPSFDTGAGDSPELEALFDSVAQSAHAPTVAVAPPPIPVAAPAPSSASGDNPELEALFDSIAQAAHTPVAPPPPPAPISMEMEGDNPELEALFDAVVQQTHAMPAAEPVPSSAPSPVNESNTSDREAVMYSRVGQLTRKFHDALRELGYDKSLERAASAIPDAKDRLQYVATMTEQAAERVLNATDRAKPLQDEMERQAQALSQGWQQLFDNKLSVEEFKLLTTNSHRFFNELPSKTQATNQQLMEIVMAQDFQDLTGQVIKRVLNMVQQVEGELVEFLMEYSPEREPEQFSTGLENGPVINASGRTDVVANQQQVDDLLESLGF